MAFSFGGFGSTTGASSGFGASSTPAFGASSAPAFGASSTPAFGASTAPAFGASSSPFGGQSSAPSLFGGQSSTPSLFGGQSSAPSLFGGQSSAPSLFGGGQSSTPSLFGGGQSSTPSLFGGGQSSTPSLFGGASAASSAPGSSLFSFSGQQQPQSALAPLGQQQQQQQPSTLITYNTKYEDLPPDRQQELLAIQREISNYREDCDKLARDQRLHDSVALKRSMEEETSGLKQILQGMANSVKADDDALGDFREKVMQLLRSTESAVRTFQRSKLWRDAPQQYKGQVVPPQVQELLASPVVLPSPYLEQAVQGFQDTLDTYRQVVGELEQVLPADPSALAGMDESHALQALPITVSYMHDYFVHVAAQMEQLHNMVARAKDAFLAQRQASGDMTNPFQDSRRLQHLSAPNKPVVIPPASGLQPPGTSAGLSHHPGPAAALPAPGHFNTPQGTSPPPPFAAASPFGAATFGTDTSGDRRQARARRR